MKLRTTRTCIALAFTIIFFTGGFALGQNLALLDSLNFPVDSMALTGTSDCWPYVDGNDVDYAIVGNVDHVAFVRASDGMVVDTLGAPVNFGGYYHRDMVTHGNYCYIVSEKVGYNEGMMIVDLSPLPDSVRLVGTWTINPSLRTYHNIDIDPGTGHLYLEGNSPVGVHIVSIANPEQPVEVGTLQLQDVHDMYARNDTLWVAEGFLGQYSIWDVSNKQSPQLIAQAGGPGFGLAHNIWPSDDGRYFVTTEETANKTVKIWELSGAGQVTLRGEYLGASNLAHNAQVSGRYIFLSHYAAGITVVDMSIPDTPVEVARYDTYPAHDSAQFVGCWGATFPSANGKVYASSIEGKLHIFDWTPGPLAVDDPTKGQALAWPNPFSEVTNIPLDVPGASNVLVTVHDLQGRRIATLMDRELAAGRYVLPWRPQADVAAGTYILQVRTGDDLTTGKVVLRR